MRKKRKFLSGKTGKASKSHGKRLAEAKKNKRALLRQKNILNEIIDGIAMIGRNKKIILFNKKIATICKIPNKILTSKNINKIKEYSLKILKHQEKFLAKVHDLVDFKSKKGSDEIKFIKGKFLYCHSVPLRDVNIRRHGRTWFFQNITERKNKEAALKREVAFEKLIGQVAKNLVRSASYDVNGGIQDVLNKVGNFLGVDRACIFLISADGKTKECVYEWERGSMKPFFHQLPKKIPRDFFQMLERTVAREGIVHIKNVSALNNKWAEERKHWIKAGVKSVLCTSIHMQNKYRGYFCFKYVTSSNQLYKESNIGWFKILGELFSVVLERKEIEKQLVKNANFDALTSLPNRYKFDTVLDQMLAYSARHKLMLAVLSMDVDNLKEVNDTYGHEVGDILLKEVSQRLRENVRAEDFIARIGGDEFVAVIFGTKDLPEVETVVKRISEVCRREYHIEGHRINTTISIGIACYPRDGQNRQILLKNADIAMYKVKEAGKNNYYFFNKELQMKH